MGDTGNEERSGYGGKWKKWLLIYLAIAVVAYAIIYFVFIRDSGAYGGGGSGSSGGGTGGYWLVPIMLQAQALRVFSARRG